MDKSWFKGGVFGAGAAALLGALFIAEARAEVEVAVVGPMTGQFAQYGEQMLRGANQAAADLNSSGGVLGEEVDINVEDDQCDPGNAVTIANFLPGDNIRLVVGHFCSIASIPASKIYEEENIIQISPAPGDPKLTEEGGDNIFRIAGREDSQAKLAAHVLVHYFPDLPIAILHNGGAYGESLAETVKRVLNERGITEAIFEEYVPAQSDYSEIVAELEEAGIAALYVGGDYREAGIIIRTAHELEMRLQLIGSDSLAAADFWAIAGDAGEGTLVTLPLDPRTIELAAPVIARFRSNRFEPEGITLYAYAAVQAWAQAAETAGSFEAAVVADVLHQDSFQTVLGTIVFDEFGDINIPGYVWHRWSNGELSIP